MDYLVTSDIHLGHRRVPTLHIANSFRKQILNKQNQKLDLIFIAGDLFDRLIESNSKELLTCIGLFTDLLNYCFNNEIKLRILEGTPSHDHYQNRILVKLNEVRKNKVDLKYFDTLDIEYIEEFDKHVLYLPDEWTHDHDLLESQIEEKLREHAIQQIDISILHTQFQYQVAGIPFKGFTLKEPYFLNLTKGYIHIGHFHNHSTFDRISAQGSLERLSHGQEEEKGHTVVINGAISFIPNPHAYIFKTINVNTRTTLNRLDEHIFQYPKESYIRIAMTRDHPFNLSFQELKLRYMDYHIERKVSGSTSDSSTGTYIVSDEELELLDSFIIDSDIKNTLASLVRSKYELSEQEDLILTNHLEVFNNAASTDTN